MTGVGFGVTTSVSNLSPFLFNCSSKALHKSTGLISLIHEKLSLHCIRYGKSKFSPHLLQETFFVNTLILQPMRVQSMFIW